jgi:uncharacterized membrane protein
MTSQVSEVEIRDRDLRKLVLVHGLSAFVFSIGILAMTVNAIGDLVSS